MHWDRGQALITWPGLTGLQSPRRRRRCDCCSASLFAPYNLALSMRYAAPVALVLLLFTVAGCSLHRPAEVPAARSPGQTAALPDAAAPPRSAATARTSPAAASPIAEQSVRAHMEFLASDALNGRGSGTRDEWIAATYIAAQFRQWGLEPLGDNDSFVQTVAFGAEEATAPPVLTIGAQRFVHGAEMLVTILGRVGVSGPLHRYKRGQPVPADAVVVMPADAAQPEDLKAVAAAAIVMTHETPQVRSGWDAAAARMPALPLRAVRLPPLVITRATRIALSSSAHAAVMAMPDSMAVRFDAEIKHGAPSTQTWNAVGRLSGSDPVLGNDIIVLSAHLDHLGVRPNAPGADKIFNGADDDASGTIAVMELAHALATGPRPKRTIVFALFGSEETGGRGAGFFVDLPVVPLHRVVANLQFEMLGRPDPLVPRQTLWLTGYERSNLGAALAKQGARLVADPRPEQSFFMRSDNIRFASRGVVAHAVSSFNLHKEYHQPSDAIGLIDFAHMTAAIQSMLEPVRWLADSPFKPEWAPNGCPAPCK